MKEPNPIGREPNTLDLNPCWSTIFVQPYPCGSPVFKETNPSGSPILKIAKSLLGIIFCRSPILMGAQFLNKANIGGNSIL